MAQDKKSGLFLSPDAQQYDHHNSEGTGSFILSSPTNSTIKSPSVELKKTKYQKLYKLFQKELAKRDNLEEKTIGLQKRKSTYQDLCGLPNNLQKKQTQQPSLINQLEDKLAVIKTQNAEQTKLGQENLKNQLKSFLQLEAQIRQQKQMTDKKNSDHSRVIEEELNAKNAKKTELQRIINSVTNQIGQNRKIFASQSQRNVKSRNSVNILDLKNLNDEKRELETSLKTITHQLNQVNSQNPLQSKDRQSDTFSSLKQMQAKITEQQQEKAQFEKQIKSIRQNMGKQKKTEQTSKKNFAKLEKQLKQADDNIQKIQKEEKQVRNKLQRVKEQTKEKYVEVPAQYQELKVKNQNLKQQILKLERLFISERDKESDLVPQSVIQSHKQKIEKGKIYYEENQNLGERIKKSDNQIKVLLAQKESLEWDINPMIKNLEDNQKKQVLRLKDLENEIKVFQKQSHQVSNKLEQYIKAYPDFQFERKKNKKNIKKQQPKKIEESIKKDDKQENKKKKKTKNSSKSLQSQTVKEQQESQKQEKTKKQILVEQQQQTAKKVQKRASENGVKQQKKKKKKKK